MGYCIEYTNNRRVIHKQDTPVPRKNKNRIVYAMMVVILLMGLLVAPIKEAVSTPGHNNVTWIALDDFFSDIKKGSDVDAAFAAFCRTIINEEIS